MCIRDSPEIVDTIRLDGPRVMLSVFGVLIVTALLVFRSVFQTLYVLFTVVIALLWLAGVFAILDWKLNLFNLIALPLLIGMGQDDSLHIIHRYREEGPGSIPRVLRETGGAVFLTTLTTVIGFSSMLFVEHQGLRSLGWTNVIGMTLCLLSSVLFVPACLRIAGSGTILLIEDAVYGAIRGTTVEAAVKEALVRFRIVALQPDLDARAVADRVIEGVGTVDYAGFVDLVAEHRNCQSWL